MLEEGRISSSQAMNYVISNILATAILFVPGIVAHHAARDAWLSIIMAMFFGIFVAVISSSLGLKFPNKTVIQFSETLFGKIPGKIIGLVYVLYYFYVAYYVLSQFGNLMTTAFFIETPIIVFIVVLTLLACYVTYGGLEVLARVNDIIVFFILAALTLILFLVAKDIQINNFLPIGENGIKPVIAGSIAPASWLGESAIIMMLIPFINDKKNVKKANIIAVILVSIGLMIIIICTIGSSGAEQNSRRFFTTFTLTIEYRIGAIFMVLWIAGMLMKFTTFFYAGILGLSQWLKLSEFRSIILPTAVILVVLSILSWGNVVKLAIFSDKTFPVSISSVNLLLTMLLFIAALLRRSASSRK